ncbi:hypothetical protein KIN20_004043 [Parelaphostrongylus tenuis]|uniref:Uncharacterized protein n=1 Tax=Parelaphostrongylus tenuis TaxID=148309 RepID=A0AAD5LY78_PARTN|nr:hypothetical protein KIN20_004043 [Parelaphostrongylus tenuis]
MKTIMNDQPITCLGHQRMRASGSSLCYGKIKSTELKEMWLLKRKAIEDFFDEIEEESIQIGSDFSLSATLGVAFGVSEPASTYDSMDPLRNEFYR